MSNYPAGAEFDPSAPFNSDDTCPNCGKGRMRNIFDDIYKCPKCGYMEKDGQEFTEEEED